MESLQLVKPDSTVEDFVWLRKLFGEHTVVTEAWWFTTIDETYAAKELGGIKLGYPKGPRLKVFDHSQERFSTVVDEVDLEKEFLGKNEEAVSRTALHERVLIIFCGQGLDEDGIWDYKAGEKRGLLMDSDENGLARLCTKPKFMSSITKPHTFIAASRSLESFAFLASFWASRTTVNN
ncbi:MAG: hypothetical protein MMC33_010165 [Icmadophila ericetorum]|nr:hypothetical protein [Icmadophila ericetorum]